MAEKKIVYNGVSFMGLLFIAFLVLKLTNVINWSWWWIKAPLRGPTALVVGVLLLFFIISFIIVALTSK